MLDKVNLPIVFMFSGQGSQYYNMGRELYDNNPRFKLWMDYCDEIASAFLDASFLNHLYKRENIGKPFDNLLFSNPALLSIEYSLARVLAENNVKADFYLGYSLGEITASVLSGAITLEEGIRLSVEFAKILENNSSPASMLAIMASVDLVKQHPDFFESCWVTGENFQGNFVIAGRTECVHALKTNLTNQNIVSQMLPVKYGFHTELLDSSKNEFDQVLGAINFNPLNVPIVSSLNASQINDIDADYLWAVVREKVNFEKAVKKLLLLNDYTFVDVGPSGTLSTFVKYILSSDSCSKHYEVMNQYGKNIQSFDSLTKKIAV